MPASGSSVYSDDVEITIRLCGLDELDTFRLPVITGFGIPFVPEAVERVTVPELEIRFGAFEGSSIVGAAGSFSFEMTTPGGAPVAIEGLTMVGVMPTHRRRGILRNLMRRHIDEVRHRGKAIAALFASEGAIYGRFGYGMASLSGAIEVNGGAAFARPAHAEGSLRLVGEDAALETFPQVWDRVRAMTPGMISRSAGWWRIRRISDPSWARTGRAQLQRALLTLEGRPAAYALYRPEMVFDQGIPSITIEVVEAVGDSPAATREIWRYLLNIDLVRRVKATRLPVDHPLLFLMAEQRQLHMRLEDTLWVRIVDVAAALGARSYDSEGALVFDLVDAFCPWNEGRWKLEDGIAKRTSESAHLTLDAEALGAVYLGAFGFTQLAEAGRVMELREGALRRADRLFRASRAPWCPEVF